jgi:hypothetical protein
MSNLPLIGAHPSGNGFPAFLRSAACKAHLTWLSTSPGCHGLSMKPQAPPASASSIWLWLPIAVTTMTGITFVM